jgi:hypothetical protein
MAEDEPNLPQPTAAIGSRGQKNRIFGVMAVVSNQLITESNRNRPLQPRHDGGATGKPCPDLRRRGARGLGGGGGVEEFQWEGVPAWLRAARRLAAGSGKPKQSRAEPRRVPSRRRLAPSPARSGHDGDCTE